MSRKMSQTRVNRRSEQLPESLDPVIKRLFKKEFENILFRSNRAAMMEYEVASKIDKEIFTYEYRFYAVGLIGIAVAFVSQVLSTGTSTMVLSISGILAAIPSAMLVVFKCLNDYSSTDTATFVPFLRRRVAAHNNAAAKWQNLERLAQQYLILLEQPGMTCNRLEEWHNKLLEVRKDICMNVIVNSDDHKKYNNEDLLKENISTRKKVYNIYKRENFNIVDQPDTSYSDDE